MTATYILRGNYPLLDLVDFYFQGPDGSRQVSHPGDGIPFTAREVGYRSPAFRFSLGPEEKKTFFLRVKENPVGSVSIPKSKAAALRREKEMAEAAGEMKDKFTSLVSHVLKAPVATFTGYAHLLRHDLEHGSGLGLPICRDIIHAHGGDIRVESPRRGNHRFLHARLIIPVFHLFPLGLTGLE